MKKIRQNKHCFEIHIRFGILYKLIDVLYYNFTTIACLNAMLR